jgi:DNA helicase-2/ATP-dependent DNA helicase PcrA
MNEEQLAVINDRTSPVILALAGPGSGKTTVLTHRILALAKESDSRGFVIITFTNAAARELKSRLHELDQQLVLGFVGTLHGYCARLLSRSRSVTLIDEDQKLALLHQVAAEHQAIKSKRPTDKALLEAAGASLYLGVSDRKLTSAERVASDYHARMLASGTYDFDSLLLHALGCLGKGQPLCETHLFVDEFQDSAQVDDAIYRAHPAAIKFFVGDQDQSIFAFRGGDHKNIMRLVADQNVTKYSLSLNYRSGSRICQAANNVIRRNQDRLPRETVSAIKGSADDQALVDLHIAESSIQSLQHIALDYLDTKPDSCAVLFRYNAHVDEAVKYFESQNIKLARRVQVKMPEDWRKARTLLSVLSNPYNEVVMRHYIALSYPEKHVDITNRAAMAYRSINEDHFQFPDVSCLSGAAQVDAVTSALRKEQVSRESVELLTTRWKELDAGSTISDLIILLNNERTEREQGQGMTVTTFHAAKGREWDTVYLGACEQATIPGGKKGLALEEERRLFYVAMTRARRSLVFCYAKARPLMFRSKCELQQPSQFLHEALTSE